MDWTRVLKTPLSTVSVVLGAVLAVIAAAGGLKGRGFELPQLDKSGRILLGFVGVSLCGAGLYARYRSGGTRQNAISEPPAVNRPPRNSAALPEFTMIRLKREGESWKEIGTGKFRRNHDYEFAEDPVFEIAVENKSGSTLMFYKAGIRLLRREPEQGGTMGSWDYRTLEVQSELTVHCPDEWKRTQGIIDDKNSRASEAFVKPIVMNEGGSHYLFTLKLENCVDPEKASSSEVRFYLETGNGPAESKSIWLYQ
jgi:hypothetical protein